MMQPLKYKEISNEKCLVHLIKYWNVILKNRMWTAAWGRMGEGKPVNIFGYEILQKVHASELFVGLILLW